MAKVIVVDAWNADVKVAKAADRWNADLVVYVVDSA